MPTLTKTANEVFSPVDGFSAPRGAVMGEAQLWGTEMEDATDALEDAVAALDVRVDSLEEGGGGGGGGSDEVYVSVTNGHHLVRPSGPVTPAGNSLTALGISALTANTSGGRNTAIGREALTANTTGGNNSGLGYRALTATTTGAGNTGLGDSAGRALTTGGNNTAVGFGALVAATTTNNNTAIGKDALAAATGEANTAVGASAAASYTGSESTAVGASALISGTGIRNTAVGASAGLSLTTGTQNTFVGFSAGANVSQIATVINTIAIGSGTYTTANNQIVIGNSANNELRMFGGVLARANPVDRNYFLGNAGNLTVEAAAGANVGFGDSALASLTSGTNNTAIGDFAMNAHTTATGNVAVGSAAMKASITCIDCTAVGMDALTAATSGVGTTAIGRLSCATQTTAGNNTGCGDSTFRYTTSGNLGVAVGYRAAEKNTTGSGNVVIGAGAASEKATGDNSVFIGLSACGNATTGGNANVGIGHRALRDYTGADAVAVGGDALMIATGTQNTAIGRNGGGSITTGTTNVFVGNDAGYNASQKVDAVNSTAIGNAAYTTKSNQVVLGNASVTETLVRGAAVAINTTTADLFGRFYDLNVGLSSVGNTGLQINAATGSSAYLDLGVNAARLGYIRAQASGVELGSIGALPFNFITDAGTRVTIGAAGGMTIGSPSGGNKGNGTLNANAVYDDNTLLTCYPFDQAADGEIDLAKWDALVPDREVVTRDVEGVETIAIEARQHDPLRKFMARLGTPHDPMNVETYVAHWREKRHLTSLPNERNFDPRNGLSTGEWLQRLVETVELQAIHDAQLLERIVRLEQAIN